MKFRFVIISLWVLLGMAFVNVALGAQPVRSSATFVVDTTLDEEDASPGDGLCASTLSGGMHLASSGDGGECTVRGGFHNLCAYGD